MAARRQPLLEHVHRLAARLDPEADARRMERSKPITVQVANFRAYMEGNDRHPNHVQYTIKDVERGIEFMKVASPAAITQATPAT